MYIGTDKYYADLLGLDGNRYQTLVVGVRAALKAEKEGRVQVGASLYAFYHSVKKRRTNSFYEVCSKLFKLDRTEVSRYVSVMEEFGNADHTAIAEVYAAYSFSLLVELLSIPKAERHKISPDWTRKNVREFRRVLERDGVSDENEEEAPPDRYIRFKKWKRSDLCEKILELERELDALKETKRKERKE